MKEININNFEEKLYFDKLDNGLLVYLVPLKNKKNFYVSFGTKYGNYNSKFKVNNKIYEIVDIVRAEIDKNTNMQIKKEKLYSEKVEITYELSKDIKIEER